MGLVLKHVERTKSGSFQYRRRVPRDVAAIIAKREFKRKLGDSERESLAAYPRYHAQVEREIEAARRRLALSDAASSPTASEREAYVEALRRRADLIEAGVAEEGLALTADSLADSYPQDEYEPVGVPPVERHSTRTKLAKRCRWSIGTRGRVWQRSAYLCPAKGSITKPSGASSWGRWAS